MGTECHLPAGLSPLRLPAPAAEYLAVSPAVPPLHVCSVLCTSCLILRGPLLTSAHLGHPEPSVWPQSFSSARRCLRRSQASGWHCLADGTFRLPQHLAWFPLCHCHSGSNWRVQGVSVAHTGFMKQPLCPCSGFSIRSLWQTSLRKSLSLELMYFSFSLQRKFLGFP